MRFFNEMVSQVSKLLLHLKETEIKNNAMLLECSSCRKDGGDLSCIKILVNEYIHALDQSAFQVRYLSFVMISAQSDVLR